MNSSSTSNPPSPSFEEHQPSSLEDALGMTMIQLIASIQPIIPDHDGYQRLTLQAARLIPLYGHDAFNVSSDHATTHHLEKLKDLGSVVLCAVNRIATLVQTRRTQNGFIRILTHKAYTSCLYAFKEQLHMAVEAFKVHSIYEARHRVLELVIERLRDLITDVQDTLMQHLERRPAFQRIKVGPTWLSTPIPVFEAPGGQGVPGVTFYPGVSNPYFPYGYGNRLYAPVSTQPNSPLESFGLPPPGVHLTINMIGSGNTTTSTMRNVSNDNSEVYGRNC